MPFGRHPLKMVCLPISPLPHGGEPYKYSKGDVEQIEAARGKLRLGRRKAPSDFEGGHAVHPAREGLLVRRTRGVSGAHIQALLGLAILA